MPKRKDQEWRDRAAAALLIHHFSGLDDQGPTLVMGDPLTDVVEVLTSRGFVAKVWNRRISGGKGGDPWPQSGPFSLAALRLPRGKDELSMSLHAAASVLEPGGSILVYGAKDEGIRSALGAMEELCPGPETVAIGGRCRVLRGALRSGVPGLRGSLDEWRDQISLDYPELPSPWTSYPGVFARGRLDDGTRLLLDAMPNLLPGARILDYGCGSGVVGYVAGRRGEKVAVHLLDVDAVALKAAEENVPGSHLHLHDGLPGHDAGPYDAIFSNPPFHRGKTEDPEMIVSLVRRAPLLLHARGMLVFVAQRRLPLEAALHRHFRDVAVLAEDSTFRVWKCRGPRKEKGRK